MYQGSIRRAEPARTTRGRSAAAGHGELGDALNQRSSVRTQQILQNALDASPQVVAQRKLAQSLSRAGVVQLAKPGELQKDDIVEVDDDGVLLRGRYIADIARQYDDEEEPVYYGSMTITHDNNVPTDEWESDYRLEKIRKYEAAPIDVKKIPATGAKFTHFNPTETTASEYIKPHLVSAGIKAENKIEITNHGFGSGIYGIANPTEKDFETAATTYKSSPYDITLQNPLYLQSAQHGTLLTELSKQLQRTAEAIRKEYPGLVSYYGVSDWLEGHGDVLQELTKRLKAVLIPLDVEAPDGAIEDALFDFFVAYNSHDLVEQPINVLLKKLGYDGIYADNPSDNSYSRGNVAFNVPKDTRKTTHVERQK